MANGMVLTNAGRDILALALTGKELKFTRGAVGDGATPSNPKVLTALIHERKSLSIQSMYVRTIGTCECIMTITNTDQTSGMWLREYGLFVQHPDTKKEVLYAYCNKGNEAGYLEGYDGANPISLAITLITIIDQAANVTAEINPNYLPEEYKAEIRAYIDKQLELGLGDFSELVVDRIAALEKLLLWKETGSSDGGSVTPEDLFQSWVVKQVNILKRLVNWKEGDVTPADEFQAWTAEQIYDLQELAKWKTTGQTS